MTVNASIPILRRSIRTNIVRETLPYSKPAYRTVAAIARPYGRLLVAPHAKRAAAQAASATPTSIEAKDNMADQDSLNPETAPEKRTTEPQAATLAQYIKDLSVENPNAPQVFQWQDQPQLDVQFNINVDRVVGRRPRGRAQDRSVARDPTAASISWST